MREVVEGQARNVGEYIADAIEVGFRMPLEKC
jgi:hypothetical protein